MYNFISIEEKNSFYKKQKWFLFLKYKISWMDNNETSPFPQNARIDPKLFSIIITFDRFHFQTRYIPPPYPLLPINPFHIHAPRARILRTPAMCRHEARVPRFHSSWFARVSSHDPLRPNGTRRERWNEWILNGESSETVSSER